MINSSKFLVNLFRNCLLILGGYNLGKSENQKSKLIRLAYIFFENTDDRHAVTIKELIEMLKYYEIGAQRKSLYDDIRILNELGLKIVSYKSGGNTYYHVEKKLFDIAEIEIICDEIQSSKFITEDKSKEIIEKLKKLVSKYEAKNLQRQIHVEGRIKSMDDSVHKNIKIICEAIWKNKQIEFRYFEWDANKNPKLKHNGKIYKISPSHVHIDNQNYYLVGYEDVTDSENKIKHFRIDKMVDLKLTDINRRSEGIILTKEISTYSQKHFSMYGGNKKYVKLRFRESLINAIVDRFGRNILINKVDEEWYDTYVEVVVSRQFYGWIFGLGKDIKIVEPADTVREMGEILDEIRKNYL